MSGSCRRARSARSRPRRSCRSRRTTSGRDAGVGVGHPRWRRWSPSSEGRREEGMKDEKDEMARSAGGGSGAEPPTEWRIVEPLKARADTFAVDGLLDALAAIWTRPARWTSVDPKQVGLDNRGPRCASRRRTARRFCRSAPRFPPAARSSRGSEEARRRPGGERHDRSQIDREPGAWRDRQLFRGDRDTIGRIALTAAGQKVVLSPRTAASGWRARSPTGRTATRSTTSSPSSPA